MENEIDVEATVSFGGPTGQSGAIRWGIAWGLRKFLNKTMVEKMKVGRYFLHKSIFYIHELPVLCIFIYYLVKNSRFRTYSLNFDKT